MQLGRQCNRLGVSLAHHKASIGAAVERGRQRLEKALRDEMASGKEELAEERKQLQSRVAELEKRLEGQQAKAKRAKDKMEDNLRAEFAREKVMLTAKLRSEHEDHILALRVQLAAELKQSQEQLKHEHREAKQCVVCYDHPVDCQ